MNEKVKLVKPLRYGVRFWEAGTIGTITETANPLTFNGEAIYDYYIKLEDAIIGVFKHEIEIIGEEHNGE